MRMLSAIWLPIVLAAVLPAQDGQGDQSTPKAWFSKVFHDEGTVFEGAKISHVFPFKNPTAEPHVIKVMQKTCACAMAWLVWDGKEVNYLDVAVHPITVPPGGEGGIKVLLDMTGIRGLKDGTVTMVTDDPQTPSTTVKYQATGVHYFEVTPPSLSFGELSWKEHKEFSFTVTSSHVKQWSILKIGTLPEGIRLQEPQRSEADGKIVYKVSGTIGPDLPPGPAGGTVRLHTDFKDFVIEVMVAADVKQPYTIAPKGFFSFGLVRQAKGSPERLIEIENKDPEHRLELLGAALEDLNRPSKHYRLEVREGTAGKIELVMQIRPGAPQGLIRGNIVLRLSHPKAPRQVIGFSASVR